VRKKVSSCRQKDAHLVALPFLTNGRRSPLHSTVVENIAAETAKHFRRYIIIIIITAYKRRQKPYVLRFVEHSQKMLSAAATAAADDQPGEPSVCVRARAPARFLRDVFTFDSLLFAPIIDRRHKGSLRDRGTLRYIVLK